VEPPHRSLGTIDFDSPDHSSIPSPRATSGVVFEVQSQNLKKGARTKTRKKKSATRTRFRPGTTGACEAQLWRITGPGTLPDDNDSEVLWVAAESLDAALRYIRLRHDDFVIKEARFLSMIPLLSGSPLD
jgi:hypothetical protein